MRPVIFHPKARDAIQRFPRDVRIRLGRALFRLQLGERVEMPHSRPMPVVAAGVSELRVPGEDGIFRAFYYAAGERGILVFHAFAKKSQRTPVAEVETGRRRLKELLHG